MKKSLNLIILAVFAMIATIPTFAADGDSDSQPVININTAEAEHLMLLPRIGPKTADRIIVWRDKNGPFQKTTDILQVKGIGDATYEMLSPYLVLEGKTTLSVKQKTPRKSKPSNAAQ